MEITASQVKDLRDKTGAGMMDCKSALQETGGNLDEAVTVLRKRGLATAAKKAGRATAEGRVGSYIHAGGRIGVMVEINCETDFVAKTDEFQALVKDVGMHVAAAHPRYVRREDVPVELVESEKHIFREQALASGKPEKVIDKIIGGKLDRFFQDICLLEQAFVKDPDRTVKEILHDAVATLGENIQVRRFARFGLGESAEGEDASRQSEPASAGAEG